MKIFKVAKTTLLVLALTTVVPSTLASDIRLVLRGTISSAELSEDQLSSKDQAEEAGDEPSEDQISQTQPNSGSDLSALDKFVNPISASGAEQQIR